MAPGAEPRFQAELLTMEIRESPMERLTSQTLPPLALLQLNRPWPRPLREAMEPKANYADSSSSSRLESPPTSPMSVVQPSTKRKESIRQEESAPSSNDSTIVGEVRRELTSKVAPRKRNSRLGSTDNAYVGIIRGIKLRKKKQEPWRNIESLLRHCGGLQTAKRLHKGNRKKSAHEFQELEILNECENLLREIIQDDNLLIHIRSYFAERAHRRREGSGMSWA